MPEDHPKFSAFYDWAYQVRPDARVRKRSAPRPTASPSFKPQQTLLQRSWNACRPWFPHIIVGIVATVVGGIILACILKGAGLDRSIAPEARPITSPASPPAASHPWNEDMTITPAK